MILEVFREKQKIDNIFSLASQLDPEEELLAHWAKYLCVLTSGFIENSLRAILTKYSIDKASPQVANYVESRIKEITNLNEEKIAQLLGSFSSEWRDQFRSIRTDSQKDAINSVIINRHHIVHGRSVSLTMARMKYYYIEVIRAITLIDENCVNRT